VDRSKAFYPDGSRKMDQETISEVVSELSTKLRDRFLGKIFQMSAVDFAFDFGLKNEGYLFISIHTTRPRMYLIKRRLRDLEKASIRSSAFAQAIKTRLGGGCLTSATAEANDRIVRLSFRTANDFGDIETRALIAQLTGRSANLYLLDSEGVITHALRTLKGAGQQTGEYKPPRQTRSSLQQPALERAKAESISAALDEHYTRLESQQALADLGASLTAKLQKEITKLKKLKANLNKDLAAHGEPAAHRRVGDLLLANIAEAEREGNKVRLKDYYAQGTPTIELQIDENSSLQEAASQSFARYTKAKRAVAGIGTRLTQIDIELGELEKKRVRLQKTLADNDEAGLAEFSEPQPKRLPGRKKDKTAKTLPGVRQYISSDGYEVLVGRTARDNDTLTFRVARPYDLWLHAGDYPGSHVIVRNSSRKDIPHRTVIEAAQLAAKFSQAGKDTRVAVHYTPRKFLAKPKGSASGLVRMSSFRTITVEPGENIGKR
jgi:predicted ribosome quality control (RQC) complex YloA/Tae2 family protein